MLAVFDIDGVVADVRHRLHHLSPPRSWRAFFAEAADDPLLEAGARRAHESARRHEIAWLTGRPEWLRTVTAEWLTRHGLPAGELHMRRSDDRRPARVFKVAVLRRLASRGIAEVVDDDPEVIEAVRAAGLPAVLADWVPREAVLRDAQERLGRT